MLTHAQIALLSVQTTLFHCCWHLYSCEFIYPRHTKRCSDNESFTSNAMAIQLLNFTGHSFIFRLTR